MSVRDLDDWKSSPLSEAPSTRDRIKAVAAELFVVRGHDGFSFGDIAEIVCVTRANIHHHFGNKHNLMSELVADIAENAQSRIVKYWSQGDYTLADRLAMQLDDLRGYYRRYNPEPGDRRIWSPVSRLRHDLEIFDDEAVKALQSINRTYDKALTGALVAAIGNGDLVPETPVGEVARLLRVSFLAAPPMTQDSGSFEEIERLFAALDRTVVQAWATKTG